MLGPEKEEEWEDLGDGITYRARYDPAPLRERLGLDGHAPAPISQSEKNRLANMLWNSGYMTLHDLDVLGAHRKPNPDYEYKPFSNNLAGDRTGALKNG